MSDLVTEMVWAKHPEHEAPALVPKSAIPMLRQSNWEPLTDKEVADLEKTDADRVAEAEEAMRVKAREGDVDAPPEDDKTSAAKRAAKTPKGSE